MPEDFQNQDVDLPAGPPPAVPDDLPPPLPDELAGPPPTLSDAALSGPAPAAAAEQEVDAPPMSSEQIIGLVAEISAFGLPPAVADAYKEDYKTNPLVHLGVQMSGLADALAAYGLTSGGGKLPEWLSVSIGVAVLGYGVYSTRSKYAPITQLEVPRVSEEVAAGGFDLAGGGTPVSTTNLGFAGAGA